MKFTKNFVSMETKLCRKCGRILSIDSFTIDNHMHDGRSCYCRECRKLLDYKRKVLRMKAIALGRNPMLAHFTDAQLIEEVLIRLKTRL